MKAAMLVLPVVISATAAFALKQETNTGKLSIPKFQESPECSVRPDFLTEARTEIVGSLDKLPQIGLLVARDAEYYVEGHTDSAASIKVHGYQSFVKPNSATKIICGQSAKTYQERFVAFAPTLIDTTSDRKVGDSVWQFQILADKDKFSIWNMKMPFSNSEKNLDKVLTQMGTKYRLYQISHNEYEMMVIQEANGITQYLSIRYDAVASIK